MRNPLHSLGCLLDIVKLSSIFLFMSVDDCCSHSLVKEAFFRRIMVFAETKLGETRDRGLFNPKLDNYTGQQPSKPEESSWEKSWERVKQLEKRKVLKYCLLFVCKKISLSFSLCVWECLCAFYKIKLPGGLVEIDMIQFKEYKIFWLFPPKFLTLKHF